MVACLDKYSWDASGCGEPDSDAFRALRAKYRRPFERDVRYSFYLLFDTVIVSLWLTYARGEQNSSSRGLVLVCVFALLIKPRGVVLL